MRARNRGGIGFSYGPPGYIRAGGSDSLQSIPGLLKSLKIPSLNLNSVCGGNTRTLRLKIAGPLNKVTLNRFSNSLSNFMVSVRYYCRKEKR
jgi:hypothetical protein